MKKLTLILGALSMVFLSSQSYADWCTPEFGKNRVQICCFDSACDTSVGGKVVMSCTNTVQPKGGPPCQKH